ncbi:WXG100 family type VII secretion target [Nocardia sp. NPDC004568]|uniref:WXG100 family type VII secretion target n=1 Tax=Nocardia sp. NPDC004568 TaxID=3154551 RepID=UPI00339EB1CA
MGDDGGLQGPQDVSVVPEEVRSVGRYVYGIADALRRALESAGSDVDSLTGGSWVGDDAAEFAAGWTDVRDGGVRIIDALTGMAEKLGVTADTYQATDDGISDAFSSLRL